MAFNARMSMARSSQPASSHGRSRKEESEDAFMMIPDQEIASCITDIGVTITAQDLQKPNPQLCQRVFEWFIEIVTNFNRDIVAPGMKAAAEDVCAGEEEARIFHADTRELMGFFVLLRGLLLECGYKDFTFADLYRPQHDRLTKIFSYMINFIRFRESQTKGIDQHYTNLDSTKSRLESVHVENEEKAELLESLQRNRSIIEQTLRDKESRSSELKNRLLELKRNQERVTERLERAKIEQSRLKLFLEDKSVQALTVRKEADKLRPYTQQSPSTLESDLRELSSSVANDKAEIERLDRRDRALKTSCDTFSLLTSDVQTLTRLFNDVQDVLKKEEEESTTASRRRDALSEKSNNIRDIERQERVLAKQLSSWTERIDGLRKMAGEKAELAGNKMDELRSNHEELGRERRTRDGEVERRRLRIELVEKKAYKLKEDIDKEVMGAKLEYKKMEDHIRLYMRDMENNFITV